MCARIWSVGTSSMRQAYWDVRDSSVVAEAAFPRGFLCILACCGNG